MATTGNFGGDNSGGGKCGGHDGGGADDQKGTPTGGDSVLLEFDLNAKPLIREALDKDDLFAMIEERGLLNDRDWNEDDHHDIANILVGRSLDINPTNPNDAPLMQLAHRIGNEYERSEYFLYLMEPPWFFFSQPADHADHTE